MNVATLGILGGGQLGRMTALAARPFGVSVRVLDPDPSCAARPVVEHVEVGAFGDAAAAERMARACDVVTLEIEMIAPAALAAVEAVAPLRPSRSVVEIVQDRVRQKTWLKGAGFPVGPHRIVDSPEALGEAVRLFGSDVYAKSAFGGYDGRGLTQVASEIPVHDEAARRASDGELWRALGGAACVVEQALDLECELSVLIARDAAGRVAVYPAARNHHEREILVWSVLPGGFDLALEREAQDVARAIAEVLDVVGLLCVEFFRTAGGRLFVNELAPRPHNSYHASLEGAATSQFEQLVRAVCGWPLGTTEIVRPTAIVNLLGDLWADGRVPAFERALELPGVRLHLYGKGEPRAGRKMGHLSAAGPDPETARAAVLAAFTRL